VPGLSRQGCGGRRDSAARYAEGRIIGSRRGAWLLGTHQGAVNAEHLDYYLDEYTFLFNRWTSGSRGLLFLRLMQQAVDLSPVPAKDILGGRRPAKINRLIQLESSA
jgi:hypothetical protein